MLGFQPADRPAIGQEEVGRFPHLLPSERPFVQPANGAYGENIAKRFFPIGNIGMRSQKSHRYVDSSLYEALVIRGTTVYRPIALQALSVRFIMQATHCAHPLPVSWVLILPTSEG